MEKQKKKQIWSEAEMYRGISKIRKMGKDITNIQTGITLIALVISIIVMLILAGVSLNMTVGENGIISKAQNAKIAMEEAELKEQVQIVVADAIARNQTNPMAQDEIRDYIKERFYAQKLKATIENDEDGFVIVYGVYSKNIWYLNGELVDYKELAAVIGSTEDWTYTVDPETQKALLTGYNYDRLGTTITIPNVIDGYLISGLGDQVFMLRTGLTEVTFSEGLRTIGARAFSGCSGLVKINDFPATLTSIGEEAFYGCSNLGLDLKFSEYIESVGSRAFYNCSKITGTVSNLLRTNVSYGETVFSGCSKITGDIAEAMAVLIAEEDTEIPANIFSGMSGLTGTVTIGRNIEKIGEKAFYVCTGITGLNIDGASSLKEIDDKAFFQCMLMSGTVNFAEGIEKIGDECFRYCHKLTEVTLPSTLKDIGSYAVSDCYGCKKLILNCGDSAFEGENRFFENDIKLVQIEFGEMCTITEIPAYCFNNCNSLEKVSIPSSITTISIYGFANCTHLKEVEFSECINIISVGAFYNCNQLLTLPIVDGKIISSLTTLGADSFRRCYLLGKNVDENGVESKTNLITLLSQSNITSIGGGAFLADEWLEGSYGDNLQNNSKDDILLGTAAFDGTSITRSRNFVLTDTTQILANEFSNVTSFIDSNNNPISEIVIPSTVKKIGANAFSNCTSITKVTIPSSVTEIGVDAFASCYALVEVVNNSSCNYISYGMFRSCISLSKLYASSDVGKIETGVNAVLSNIEKIETSAFEQCTSLENVDFGSKLTQIGGSAFRESGIKSVTLPASVSKAGGLLFYKCKNLKTVDFSACKILSILGQTFDGCTVLSNVTLNSTLETVEGSYVFHECSSLESIAIPSSVTTLRK